LTYLQIQNNYKNNLLKMGASLVYLDRPLTKKDTSGGVVQATQTQPGYRYACSAMQGWRLNMVSLDILSYLVIRKMHTSPTQLLLRGLRSLLFSMATEGSNAPSFAKSISSRSSEINQSSSLAKISEKLAKTRF
jgi:hypothetical protein